jgi:hypothetical protein
MVAGGDENEYAVVGGVAKRSGYIFVGLEEGARETYDVYSPLTNGVPDSLFLDE